MIPNPESKMKQLLDDHKNGKLSLVDLQKECAYWYGDTFETFNPRPDPTPPMEYLDYKHMPFKERSKLPSEFFKTDPIKSYLESRDKIRAENFSHTERLKEFISYIPKEDLVTISKYKEKMNQFELKDYGF